MDADPKTMSLIYIGIDNGFACLLRDFSHNDRMDTYKHLGASKRHYMRKKGIAVPLQKKGPAPVNGYSKSESKCSSCGKLFMGQDRPDSDPKKSKSKYCSRACYFKRVQGKTNPNYKGARPCKGCGVHVMGAQRAFCCLDCGAMHYKKCAEIRAPQDKLNRNMRRAVVRFLAKGIKANRPWRSLTGFSSAELMAHLESKFLNGMTWGNYGTYWHLDHIKPVAAFTFSKPEDQEFKDCWSLENLQPLTAIENLKKNSNYNGTRVYRCR